MSTAVHAKLVQVIPQELRDFSREPRSYILASAWPEPIDVKFGNTLMTLPADRQFEQARRWGTFADGSPIPGSYILTDSFYTDETTGEEKWAFNAERAIIHILGLQKQGDGKTMVCLSSFARKGVFLVPKNTTQARFEELRAAALERVRATEVQYAYDTIAAHESANAKRKLAGQGELAGGEEIERATRIVNRANAQQDATTRAVAEDRELVAATGEEELELTAAVHALAMKLAAKKAEQLKVDKTALFELLIKDPEVKAYARKQRIQVRRRGYQDVPETEEAPGDVIAEGLAELEREEAAALASAPSVEGLEDASVPSQEDVATPPVAQARALPRAKAD